MQITDMYKLDKHLCKHPRGGGGGREGGGDTAPPPGGGTGAPREGRALNSVREGAGTPPEERERGPGGHVSTKIPRSPPPRLCMGPGGEGTP